MTFKTLAALVTPIRTATAIDFKMAQSILDRLGFTLEDLGLKYGDICIENNEISHQLWYDSINNSCEIMGYVYHENGIYYTTGKHNYDTPEQAALGLLNPNIVEECRYTIELERVMATDYD